MPHGGEGLTGGGAAGYSNLNITRIYITPSEQDLEKAVEQLLFGNA